MQTIRQRAKQSLAAILPGIFLIGYNIGTGSLTAMSKAGANYGTELLWAVLVSCLITWYLINFFSRFTMASGITAMEGFRRYLHPIYAWVLWSGLAVIIVSAVMGMLGLLVDVLAVWFQETQSVQISRLGAGVLLSVAVFVVILIGNTKRFESLLGIMVALMGLAFIGSAIRFFPGTDVVLSGLVPRLPSEVSGSDNSPYVILAGMVGTTVSVFAFLIRSGQVKDHGWTMADWKKQKRDAMVSASMMFILSASVMLTATSTLHVQGKPMNSIVEMIPMLHPLFGGWALMVFVIGILSAGISSHLPNMMVIPWLTQDMFGRPRTTRSFAAICVIVVLTLVSMLGAVAQTRPVFLLLLSQAGISLVMPLALFGLMWLASRKELVGDHRPSKAEWFLLTAIAAFVSFISFLAMQGLITDIRSIFQ